MRATLPPLYSDLSRPYEPGLVAREVSRAIQNRLLMRDFLRAAYAWWTRHNA